MQKPIPHCYWVVENQLIAGEYPRDRSESTSKAKIQTILNAGITDFIDLTESGEYSISGYEHLLLGRAEHHRFAITDVSIPTSPELTVATLDRIDQLLNENRTVYLHCLGGIGRTGLTVGCWLVRHGMNGDEALHKVQQLWQTNPKSNTWPESPQTAAQKEYVRGWYQRKGNHNKL